MIKKNKGSRSWSRILAVQALYQLSLNKDAKESKVIKDLIQNKESKNRADKIFLSKLVKETIKKKTKLVNEIISASNKSKFDKMETLLKVILKLGTCELFYFKNIPINVSLSQYVKVGSSFLNDKEVGLINGILDKVSKNINNDG
ncbi:MAG: hypothetical protein CFH24_00470 [Alphaproteobacteria bacterium MarineAlpha6_Bin2]|nr:MAG: hypothetical protein CFH24_00470 [Alphaproteobacteria bacterium MarineAlpha6_Bin2]